MSPPDDEPQARGAHWQCVKCGKQNQAHYRFCLGCANPAPGAQAAEPVPAKATTGGLKHCSCGASNEGHYKFCLSCGEALVEGPAVASPPQAPAPQFQTFGQEFGGQDPNARSGSTGAIVLVIAAVVVLGAIGAAVFLVF
jgi:hypothetical protein